VGEADRPSHEGGNATRYLADLGLNVPEVGRAGPATKLFDDVRVVAEDLKLHGPAGADTVRAETGEVVARGHKVVADSAGEDGVADVLSRDLGDEAVDRDGADGRVRSGTGGDKNAAGGGPDRVERRVGRGRVVNNGVFVAVLLVFEANGDRVCGEKDRQGGVVGEAGAVAPELKVLIPQGYCKPGAGGRGIFAHPKEEKERKRHEVGDGAEKGGGVVAKGGGDPAHGGGRKSVLGPGRGVGGFVLPVEGGKFGVEASLAWIVAPRVCKSGT
jgi:hypothetical protein